MRLRSDDDIHRFQPVLYEIRGWEVPVVARYVVWAVWAVIAAIIAFVLHFFPWFGWGWGFVYGGVISGGLCAIIISDRITAENGWTSWLYASRSEGRAARHDYQTYRARPPAGTFTIEQMAGLTFQPEPTWNPLRWIRPTGPTQATPQVSTSTEPGTTRKVTTS